MTKEITEDECKFCNPELNYDLNIICSKYSKFIRREIPNKTKILLNKIFDSEEFYLPQELVLIIFKYLEIEKTNKISKINLDSVLHFGNCEECSCKLLKYFHDNICYKHVLPMCILPEKF